MKRFFEDKVTAACGVGFLAGLNGEPKRAVLERALRALARLEHRGGVAADGRSSDGAGILTDIPNFILSHTPGKSAAAMLFLARDPRARGAALDLFEKTFAFMGAPILGYRDVPIDAAVLGPIAAAGLPVIRQALIERPGFCRTVDAFEKLLYHARQTTLTKLREREGHSDALHFCSVSARTIVYKALCRAEDLPRFYKDLQNTDYTTRFALFHRRFSTNTSTAWAVAQPFSTLGHNGEINTIAGNRSWSSSREMSLGLPRGELLTQEGLSDSGSLNEMVEALRFRSSIRRLDEIMAITIPPAAGEAPFHTFWGRAMEPWDGPALVAYADGLNVGARLDRNGFRPCRWVQTRDHFMLASEAGVFGVNDAEVVARGALAAGMGAVVRLTRGVVDFVDPGQRPECNEAVPGANLVPLPVQALKEPVTYASSHGDLFVYTREDLEKILIPMAFSGKEPIGSMGDTARSALMSKQPRSFYDFFYQDFAQVTNPPLDYLREGLVCDLSVHLGKRPNIFAPRDLLPPPRAYSLDGPVLDLDQMAALDALPTVPATGVPVVTRTLSMTFARAAGETGPQQRLLALEEEAVQAVREGVSLIILSDRDANQDLLPLPSLLALRAVVHALNRKGLRLEASLVVCSGEIRETHHVAALVSFGASAVCPYLALALVSRTNSAKLRNLEPTVRRANLVQALTGGLLKIMSKMGISVVRSYQSSKLFTPVGLGPEITRRYFKGLSSPIGGLDFKGLGRALLMAAEASSDGKPIHIYLYKEQNRGTDGEKHAMTNRASKVVHQMVRGQDAETVANLYQDYLDLVEGKSPVHLRHLFEFRRPDTPLALEDVQTRASVLKTFGSGAMSFGAISAESQRDIFKAMARLGARSNSGEGGENPYYAIDGTTAEIKQVASGRFGVTAAYLAPAGEFQIKMSQGAKPGEGGQLMGVKVNPDIARARHAAPGVDLISPPPMHDIYSIEDLKQLIYELKQFKQEARVSVKLTAGAGIGTIAVGVAKAGADVIHVSGGDGGTGAAALSSMKHAGLAWELGLVEVHRALVANGLRNHITLRVDGGLNSGRDIVLAAILGAEEYDFGKLLLVAQGCVMARICEKNTCPTGIATQDPKFKAKYKGKPEDVEVIMTSIADHTRRLLATLGVPSLHRLVGRVDLLRVKPEQQERLDARGIDLSVFTDQPLTLGEKLPNPLFEGVNDLNRRIAKDAWSEGNRHREVHLSYTVTNRDRGVPATLVGRIARDAHRRGSGAQPTPAKRHISFRGTAGQGFGAFLSEGISLRLRGQANDAVGKSMSGGNILILPEVTAHFPADKNAVIGNCALYGAVGGTLHVNGRCGDRFAVRNSGALAVAEGAGLHACEYMTGGTVVLLGSVGANLGAGMTGGQVFLLDGDSRTNTEYVTGLSLNRADQDHLYEIVHDYHRASGSRTAAALLDAWSKEVRRFVKYLPLHQATVTQLSRRA